ncbi:MAG: hypothetical protein AVDCRST_MAG68-100 [uncultured Gemmatimonadetes bacterium]|uniref:Bacterial surface antigen (D15) domain-containing protein n=1 Tax=uncultured Gemmatimonadota bacterium TaxID=203437 RepID=A0A6J4K6P8_9BACT|nr:MAG: hypothetical protein AVDCRST_MAG68-100 [uncultured Gemmatimonadota bacterium]
MKHRIFAGLALALAAAPARAQAPAAEGWNSPRALELIARARDRRSQALADTGMLDYQADARGFIYFYLDRPGTSERSLVKTDQVALDVMWKAPNLAKQRIVGLRDAKNLPTNIRYHEDHLTVVQDNFGDLIRYGDGDEVRDVLHPAAGAGPATYDYRLNDSLAIRTPGSTEPVRVYEVQVRPRDPSRPAMIGSVFVDRRGGDIVRMSFTFTSAAYVDRQLDYINASLENALYKGRFWLPHRQQVELRRQLPELGFPVGGMIRGTMRISNYRFNQGLSPVLFYGPRVVSVPESQRERFGFEQPIDAELREEGIGPTTELADVRRQAAELIRGRMLSGLPSLRANVPAASSVLRYNRAEGVVAGFGTQLHPRETLRLEARGGWAFGPMHPVAEAAATVTHPGYRLGARGFVNEPRDVGVGPVVSGAVNSLSALVAGRDYTDPFYAGGVEGWGERALGAWTGTLRLRGEVHESAALESTYSLGGALRPVRPVDEGTMLGGSLFFTRAAPSGVARGWSASAGADGGVLRGDEPDETHPTFTVTGTRTFLRPRVELGYVRRWSPARAELEASTSAGAALGELPRQALFLVGGRGTIPGFPFRAFGGDRFALARVQGSADVAGPWLRGRAFASAGWAGTGGDGRFPLAAWGAVPTGDPRASLGAGVGLLYDIVRFDVARGLGPGGQWELIFEANPSFWDFL